ncbi:AraC family transcriptional regulator [Azotobacter vinelandii]|nr:helix-turn-helix transcriptional regulator [Azotobacter vinelandii]SFX09008.1 transcriptional regulator, AraC family [Azotobacter vinelandii]
MDDFCEPVKHFSEADMPLAGRRDPDRSSLPVVAERYGYPKGQRIPEHSHRRGQLMFVTSGGLRVQTRRGYWTIPPGRACWVPCGLNHIAEYPQAAELAVAYVRTDLCEMLPSDCRVLNLGALLRELVIAAYDFGWDYGIDSHEARAMLVLIGEIGRQSSAPLFIPEGRDNRLRRVTAFLHRHPDDKRSLEEWASQVGASARTLARLFRSETGLSFSQWRQQLHLTRAVEMLLEGASVTQVAYALGYASPGSFSAMFARSMGEPPSLYCRARHGALGVDVLDRHCFKRAIR